MDKVQQTINALSNQLYEWGLVTDTTNRYDLPSDAVIDFVNKSTWNIEVDKKKLIKNHLVGNPPVTAYSNRFCCPTRTVPYA